MNHRLHVALMIAVLSSVFVASQALSWPASTAAPASTPASLVLPSSVSGATNGASIAIDATGRKHVAFEVSLSGQVMYATCAANCTSPASWTNLQVGTNGSIGTRPILQLTPAGQPRLMYIREGGSGPQTVVYNACDAACTSPASWEELAVQDISSFGADLSSRFFALDGQGRPRAVIPVGQGALRYYACDSTCASSAGNWTATDIGGPLGVRPAMTVDSAGAVHTLYKVQDSQVESDNALLTYVTCAQGCTEPGNWSTTFIYALLGRSFESSYAIDTDASNRLRAVFYTGALTGSVANLANQLVYAWCNADCADGSRWDAVTIGTPPRAGFTPDLAIDGAGRPRVSYYNDDSGYEIGYAECTAACESEGGTWQVGPLETPQTYPPVPPPSGCTGSFWYATGPTSIALDAAGKPHIVFGSRNLTSCSGTVRETLRLVRYIDVEATVPNPGPSPSPGPGTPAPTPQPGTLGPRVYLPLTAR